jgi:hypothetical protein
MTAVILAFTACVIDGPCHDVEIPLDVTAGPIACMQAGQTEMVRWLTEHPGYAADRWTCRFGFAATGRPA